MGNHENYTATAGRLFGDGDLIEQMNEAMKLIDFQKPVRKPLFSSVMLNSDRIPGFKDLPQVDRDIAFGGVNVHEAPYEMIERIQVKTHKRKRINKKWAKRYGFTDQGYCLFFDPDAFRMRLFDGWFDGFEHDGSRDSAFKVIF